jgi:hypothetical protein
MKINFTRKNIGCMIYYDFKNSLAPKHCVGRFRSSFGEETPSQVSIYS